MTTALVTQQRLAETPLHGSVEGMPMKELRLAKTPAPPYFAVVFTSLHTDGDSVEYAEAAESMCRLAAEQEGYLGIESVRDADGVGITVSYWKDEDSIRNWYELAEHRDVQQRGRDFWYDAYDVRVCRVERAYSFQRQNEET